MALRAGGSWAARAFSSAARPGSRGMVPDAQGFGSRTEREWAWIMRSEDGFIAATLAGVFFFSGVEVLLRSYREYTWLCTKEAYLEARNAELKLEQEEMQREMDRRKSRWIQLR